MAFLSKLLPWDQGMLLVFISLLRYSTCKQRSQESKHLLQENWMDDMKEVESLKAALEADDNEDRESRNVKYVMNPVPEGKRLRYRLTAVGGYRDVVELKRLQDVKVNAKAKVARMHHQDEVYQAVSKLLLFWTLLNRLSKW